MGFSVELGEREGRRALGIVGVNGNHPASLALLSFDLSGGRAYCQFRNIGSATTFSVYFHVLFGPNS